MGVQAIKSGVQANKVRVEKKFLKKGVHPSTGAVHSGLYQCGKRLEGLTRVYWFGRRDMLKQTPIKNKKFKNFCEQNARATDFRSCNLLF